MPTRGVQWYYCRVSKRCGWATNDGSSGPFRCVVDPGCKNARPGQKNAGPARNLHTRPLKNEFGVKNACPGSINACPGDKARPTIKVRAGHKSARPTIKVHAGH